MSNVQTKESRNPWLVLFTVALGLFMVIIDVTILNVALPTLVRDLSAGTEDIEWVLIAYTVALTGLVPVFGRISDVFGRKRLFIGGLLFFALGSLMATQAATIAWLIGARLVQAVGGAMISSNALAIIADIFPAGKRGLAVGIQSIIISGGAALGPTLGGFLVTHFGWESVFYINLPIGLFSASLAAWILPPLQSARTREPVDLVGAATLMGGLTTVLLALTKGPVWGWTAVLTLVLLIGGLLLLGFFIVWESRHPYPLIDLSLFRSWEFSLGQLTGLMLTLSMASVMFLFPFYWQGLRGLSAQEAGWLMLPVPMMFMFISPLSGRLSDAIGARSITLTGLVAVFVGLFLMSSIGADTAIFGVIWRVLIFGFGLALFMAPNTNAVMSAVPAHKRGVAAGLLATGRYMGQSLGVAFGGSIFAHVMGGFTGLGSEGLPGADTLALLAENAAALEAFRTTFMAAMSTVFRSAMPLAGIGLLLSVLRFRGPRRPVVQQSTAD